MQISKIQQEIISSDIDTNLLVLSLPGGGKTTTLINRVNFLIQKKNVDADKILIITFTNSAVDDIKSKMNINNIFTIDSLCSKLCQKYNILDKNLLSINEPNDYKYELLKNISLVNKEWDYIFIDEVQDIDHIQYLIIKHFDSLKIKLYLTGDINQNIYNFRGTSNKYILEYEKYFSDIKKIVLDINYRSTKPIIQILNDVEKKMNTNKSVYSSIIYNKNKNKNIEFHKIDDIKYSQQIKKIIETNKFSIKKCCVISKNNEMINIIYNELFKYKKFRDIHYTTIHSSKGLQYDHLFFVDVNDGIIPYYKSNNIKEDERLYYVAISRAALSIDIMYNKKPSRFLYYHKDFFLEENKPKYKNIHSIEIDSNSMILEKMEKYYQFRKNELSKFYVESKNLESIKIPIFIKNNDLMLEYNTFLYLLLSRNCIDQNKILKLKEFEFKFHTISKCIDSYFNFNLSERDILHEIFIIASGLVYVENKKRFKGYLLYKNQKLLNKKDLGTINKIYKENTDHIFYKNSNIQEYLFKSDSFLDQQQINIIDIINWKCINLKRK